MFFITFIVAIGLNIQVFGFEIIYIFRCLGTLILILFYLFIWKIGKFKIKYRNKIFLLLCIYASITPYFIAFKHESFPNFIYHYYFMQPPDKKI